MDQRIDHRQKADCAKSMSALNEVRSDPSSCLRFRCREDCEVDRMVAGKFVSLRRPKSVCRVFLDFFVILGKNVTKLTNEYNIKSTGF